MSTDAIQIRHIPEWTFGERIRKIRRDVGLSQAEFAARIGVSTSALSAWEAGRNTPGEKIVDIAKTIRREFRVPTGWTLGTDEPPTEGGPDDGTSLPRAYSKRQPAGYLHGLSNGGWNLTADEEITWASRLAA